MRDAVVDGHQHGAAPDQRALVAQFVGEGAGVLPHRGIGDQPSLWIAVANQSGEASDDAVQSEPTNSLPHHASLRPSVLFYNCQTALLLPNANSRQSTSVHLAEFRQLRLSTMTFARTVSA